MVLFLEWIGSGPVAATTASSLRVIKTSLSCTRVLGQSGEHPSDMDTPFVRSRSIQYTPTQANRDYRQATSNDRGMGQ